MYFHVGDFIKWEILRLSADGSQGNILKVSDQFPGASKFGFFDFSVTPGGNVYVLGGTPEHEIMLLRFDQDGSMSQRTTLRVPKSVIPMIIVATEDRTFLFFGYYDHTAPSDLKGTSYMVLLDESGAVRGEIHATVPGLDVAKLSGGEGAPPGALGDDGNFYFAGSNQILVMAQDGELLRRIPFDNPYPKSKATGLHVSGGLIIINLVRVDDHQARMRYLVLLNSGGVVGYYEASKELGGWPATCYSARGEWTFLKVENRQLKLLTVRLQ
jgi:hypothetical protein